MKKLFLFGIAYLALAVGSMAQVSPVQYANTITPKELKENLTIIASDALEGRNTGSRGQKMAAVFIADHFEKLGLQPPVNGSYYQPVPLLERYGEPRMRLSINGKKFKDFFEYLYAPWGGDYFEWLSLTEIPELQPLNDASPVFIDYPSDKTKLPEANKIKGKPVFITMPNDGNGDKEEAFKNQLELVEPLLYGTEKSGKERNPIVNELIKREPSYIFILFGHEDAFQWMNFSLSEADIKNSTRFLILDTVRADPKNKPKEVPIVAISPKAFAAATGIPSRKLTYKALKNMKNIKVSCQKFIPPINKIKSDNVLGYLEGTDKKDELVVITAHYDHIGIKNSMDQDSIYNGADDDGSGTVAVMQLATAFAAAKKDGHGPRRSILFMTVTGEEEGLLGSSYYVDHPVFPLSQTVVDLNIDMIGRRDTLSQHGTDPNYVYVIGSDKLSSELHEINEKANTNFTNLSLDYLYNDEKHPEGLYYRSDHWNFAKKNIPIIFYFDGIHKDYHRPSDEVSKIEFDVLAKRVKLVFYTAWEVANRDNRIVSDKAKK